MERRAGAARCRLTASSLVGGTEKGTASLTTVAPGRSVRAVRPPKVIGRSVAVMIASPVSRTAMWAASMMSGWSPYSFEMRMRTRSPPIEVWTISRRVRLVSVGVESTESAGGRVLAGACGAVQVASQRGVDARGCDCAGDCYAVHPARSAAATPTSRGINRPISILTETSGCLAWRASRGVGRGELDEIPSIAIQVHEHRDRAVWLRAWRPYEGDAGGGHRAIVAPEVVGAQEQEDASA